MAVHLSEKLLRGEAFKGYLAMTAVLKRLALLAQEARNGDRGKIKEIARTIADERPDLLVKDLIGAKTIKYLRIASLVREGEKAREKAGTEVRIIQETLEEKATRRQA